jgi:hypothetical protein
MVKFFNECNCAEMSGFSWRAYPSAGCFLQGGTALDAQEGTSEIAQNCIYSGYWFRNRRTRFVWRCYVEKNSTSTATEAAFCYCRVRFVPVFGLVVFRPG